MGQEKGFLNKTTVGVEKETNILLGYLKEEYGDRQRNETIRRLIQKDEQLPDWLAEPQDLKAFFSTSPADWCQFFESEYADRLDEIGYHDAFREFVKAKKNGNFDS